MSFPGTHSASQPDRLAIIMGGSGETLTYRQLDEQSNQLAQYWRRKGLQRGDHVAIFMENNIHYMVAVWAALRSGLYFTPINSGLSPSEVDYILQDCGARSLITSQGVSATASRLDLSTIETRLSFGETVPGYDSIELALSEMPRSPIEDESPGWAMLYSSGTTGRPKGVINSLPVRPLHEWDPALEAFRIVYKFGPEMVLLSPAPAYHAAPLSALYSVHRFGGTVVMMERFDAEHSLALIEKHHVTHSQWVPTMFIRLLRLPEVVRNRYDLSSQVMAYHGAAPCPVDTKRQMIEWWGPMIHEYYSSTEGIGSVGISSQEWVKKPGSVGRPLPGQVVILDDDAQEQPVGDTGVVYFHGGANFVYHNDPDKTDGIRQGELRTVGDVGYLDEDGYLFLTDRKAHMIISGGVNIYPREIEDVLITHPSVADVAVFGIPHEEMGEEVKAVVELREGYEPSAALATEIIDFTRERIARFKCPRSVDFVPLLPRTEAGKLAKGPLRAKYLLGAANADQ